VVEAILGSGGTVILLTPCIINRGGTNQANEDAEKLVAQYIDVMRKIAKEKSLPVAENFALQSQAREGGQRIMAPDGIHPYYPGQALMARAILDAMGYKDVPLPATFRPRLFPGVITEWKTRLAPIDPATKSATSLTEKTIGGLTVDGTWKTYTLPETPMTDPKTGQQLGAEDWKQQHHLNGFGMEVEKRVGKGPVQAVAVIQRQQAGQAYLHVGGEGVSRLWLNGKPLDMRGLNDAGKECLLGYHAGKLRIEVNLNQGANTLVMETTGFFFVSVTDQRVWEEDYCRNYQ